MNQPIRFGKYLLVDKIGTGGMAELFLAKQTGLSGFEKVVAIKRILPHLIQGSEFVSMFINEAKLAALLSHQNIVQIYDLGNVDQCYYIAMEYIMGKDLRTVLKNARSSRMPISIGDTLLIISKICSALDYAHRKKDLQGNDLHLVHRDISPQNILVSYEGEVKLVDFGIAKAALGGQETKTGVLKGKLAYMSPEQAWGKPIDARTDVFALGIVLYEAVTGERLFTGNSEISILEKVRKADIAPPTRFNPALPPELETILHKALAKEPENRYQSASEMQMALENLISMKGYAFSSLSLSHYMKTIYEDEMVKDTQRFKLATAGEKRSAIFEDRSTIVRPRGLPNPQAAVRKGISQSRMIPPMPRKRRGSIWVAGFLFFIPPTLLFPLLLLSNMTFIKEVRAQFPFLERTRITVQQYLDERGLLFHLELFKESLYTFVEKEPTLSPISPPSSNKGDRIDVDSRFDFSDAILLDSPDPPRTVPAPPLPVKQDVKMLYQEAKKSYNAGHFDEVERRLRQIIEIDPNAALAYHLLGNIYQEKKETDIALRIFSEAVALFPNDAMLHYDLGFLYFRKGIDSLAIQELTAALKLSPHVVQGNKARQILQKLGRGIDEREAD